MRCMMQKDVVTAGEEVNVICELDNTRCQSQIGPIEVKLRNKLTLIDESGYESSRSNVFLTQQYEGVMAGMVPPSFYY